MKRSRGRSRRSNNNNSNRSFESAGPDIKIRGTAQQIYDKYVQYSRDRASSGDRVTAEAYMQYAEHYYRLLMQNENFRQRMLAKLAEEQSDLDDSPDDEAEDVEGDAPESPDDVLADGDERQGERSDDRKPRGASKRDPLAVVDVSDNTEPDGVEADSDARAPKKEGRPRRKPYAKRPRRSEDGTGTEMGAEAGSEAPPSADEDRAGLERIIASEPIEASAEKPADGQVAET